MGRGRHTRYSMSTLEQAERCLYAARLARDYDHGNDRMMRGRVVHECNEAIAQYAWREGLEHVAPDKARELAIAALQAPGEAAPLPLALMNEVLVLAQRFAAVARFYPDAELFITEQLFTREFGPWTFSGKPDYLAVVRNKLPWAPDEPVGIIRDYKAHPAIPAQGEYDQQLQLPFYVWLIAPLLPEVKWWDLGGYYIDRPAEVIYRPNAHPLHVDEATLSLDLYLTVAAGRLDDAWDDDTFPATPSVQACSFCPAAWACPIPEEENPYRAVEDDQQAAWLLEHVIATDAAQSDAKKALKAYHKQTERPIEHRGSRALIKTTEGEGLVPKRKDELFDLLDDLGVKDEFVRPTRSSNFRIEKAKA